MKILSVMVLAMLVSTAVFGQSNAVTGKIGVKFNSRAQVDDLGNMTKGVKDVYTVEDLSVGGLVVFQGKIEHLPGIYSASLGIEEQASEIGYNLIASLRNPANPQQLKAVGKLVGGVPIDSKGVYKYENGNLRLAIDAAGSAAGFESKFSGIAAGKALKGASLIDKAKKQAITMSRQVKGKAVKLVVSDYDKMTFTDLLIGAGPVRAYPETRVNGEMLFDYERSAWYFNGVTLAYQVGGKSIVDKLSGHIKWVESPQRKTNGEGEYQFDVRVNEPEKNDEAAAFAGGDDEAAFFAVDNTLAALTGTAKYKDTFRGETVVSSDIVIGLAGNNLSKQQTMALTKLVWFVCVVPVNAE